MEPPFTDQALDALGEVFFVFTVEGEILQWNRRVREVTGYSDDEIAQMHPVELVPAHEADIIKRKIPEVLTEGSVQLEAHFRTKEDRKIPYEFTGSLLEWNGEKLVCGTGRDITERKETEEALEASNRELLARLQQIRKKNALVRLMKEVASTSNEVATFEEALHAAVDAVCRQTGWPIGHVYRLREEEGAVLEPTGIWNSGSDDRFDTFRAATEKLPFAPGEGLPGRVLASGRPEWIVDLAEDANFQRSQVAAEVGVRGAFSVPVPLNGRVVAVLEFFSAETQAPDDELLEAMESVGTQLGQVAEREKARKTLQDEVEQRKHAEAQLLERARELDEAYKKLKATERMKNEFFANVSHELRTPLTLILSPVESMLEEPPESLPRPHRRMLETVHNNAIRLLQMVNGLLDFSRLEIGEMQIAREPTDIAALTRAVYHDFEPLIERNELTARLETTLDRPTVEMDRYLYERILFNLLSNAVKFTPSGGELGVSLRQTNGGIELSVTDTGKGIPESELEHIFKDFRQVDASAARRFEGTGLGLSLVKEFTDLLDGHVKVDSTPGVGSSFTVHLHAPVATREEEADDVEPSWQVTQQHPPRELPHEHRPADDALPDVVLAEDNEELSAYIEDLLVETCRLHTATNGWKALQLIRRIRPAVVITDVMIPNMDGLSLCRALKDNPTTADIPVVMLTALTNRKALLRGWEAGANEYLFKPFHPRELVTRIRTLLHNVERRREAERAVRRLEQELLRRSERERRRIGQDLHDGLASHLAGVAILAKSLTGRGAEPPSAGSDRLEEIVELAKEGARQARAMARGLNPVKLDEKGLTAALHTMADDETLRFDAACTFEQKGAPPELPEETAVNLYWIAHEAVRNAIKHGEAAHIAIRLIEEETSLNLKVYDDGKGLPPPANGVKEGMGLETMRYRAESIGATLTLSNREQGGVSVQCSLPLRQAESSPE